MAESAPGIGTEDRGALTRLLIECCSEAAGLLLDEHTLDPRAITKAGPAAVTLKNSADPRTAFTETDLAVEKRLVSKLRQSLNCRILGEEGGDLHGNSSSEFRAIIDPIDGTKNFIERTMGLFGVSVGLERDRELAAGAIALPWFGDLVVGEAGRGVFWTRLGSEALQALPHPPETAARLSSSRVVVGRGANPGRNLRRPPLGGILEGANEALSYGSCTVGLVAVMLGRVDAVVLECQHYWDFAAGLFLIRESGGQFAIWSDPWQRLLTDDDLADARASSKYSIVASMNRGLFSELVEIVRSAPEARG